MRLELHATPEEVMRAVAALQEFGRIRQVPERDLFGLALALEECGTNIVNHAYGRDARQTFRVTLEQRGGAVIVELRDHGPAFDPTADPAGRADSAASERGPGGWGLPLVRRYTDECRHYREAEENVLRFCKRFGTNPAVNQEGGIR